MATPEPTHVDDTEPDASQADEDPRLMEAMREYMAALDAGKRINRRELVARHPEIAAELSACLQGLSFIHGAAGELTDGGGGGAPAGSRRATSAPPELSNAAPLGDYQLLREIGRGGMGVVYEATQLSLGRRVAVKVLPMAAALDPRRLQRFRNEAQAAAGLHHTNIVPVYAVGSDRSTHFYAMQLIEGRSLAEVIREMRAAEVAGRRAAVARQLLDQPDEGTVADPNTVVDRTEGLDRAVATSGGASAVSPSSAWSGPRAPTACRPCTSGGGRSTSAPSPGSACRRRALDYAHGLGIIHRDIKPANLMVDGRGNLWVTDFGLAQMYGDNGITQTGDFVGTFRYMSPEQAGGGPGKLGLGRRHRPADDTDDGSDSGAPPVVLDPRTDVYSLGVTLYELLTLQPALPGRSREDLMYQLAAVDPRPPRAIDKAIPPELQTIVLKAAAKDPADRYPSARALADDLERFLADEPIHARPPTVWDHAVKWTRRHRSLALSAIVALTLAAAGLGASTLIIAAEQSRTQTAFTVSRQEEAEARHQKELAEAAYRQARSAVDDLARVAADDLPNNPFTAAVRKLMLQKALSYYQQFVSTRSGGATAAADPYLIQAQQRATAMLGELVATDNGYRVRFDIRLLDRPTVQKALSLTVDQVDRAQDLADRIGGPGGRWGSGPGGEARAAESPDAVERWQKSLASLLTPAQLDRLKQISRQLRGIGAFDDPEVQAKLDLTPEQTEAVRKIRASADAGPRDDGGGGGPRGNGGGRDQPPPDDFVGGPGNEGRGFGGGPHGKAHGFGPGSAAAVQRVIDEVLTTAQKADWAALTGAPFAGVAPSPPRRGRDDPAPPPRD